MFEGFPIGVQLTLTSEYRGYRWSGPTNGASLPPGVSEIFAHPVQGGEELCAYDPERGHSRA